MQYVHPSDAPSSSTGAIRSRPPQCVEEFKRLYPKELLGSLFAYRYTPLHAAAYYGHEEVCAWLLSPEAMSAWAQDIYSTAKATEIIVESSFFALWGGRASLAACKHIMEMGSHFAMQRFPTTDQAHADQMDPQPPVPPVLSQQREVAYIQTGRYLMRALYRMCRKEFEEIQDMRAGSQLLEHVYHLVPAEQQRIAATTATSDILAQPHPRQQVQQDVSGHTFDKRPYDTLPCFTYSYCFRFFSMLWSLTRGAIWDQDRFFIFTIMNIWKLKDAEITLLIRHMMVMHADFDRKCAFIMEHGMNGGFHFRRQHPRTTGLTNDALMHAIRLDWLAPNSKLTLKTHPALCFSNLSMVFYWIVCNWQCFQRHPELMAFVREYTQTYSARFKTCRRAHISALFDSDTDENAEAYRDPAGSMASTCADVWNKVMLLDDTALVRSVTENLLCNPVMANVNCRLLIMRMAHDLAYGDGFGCATIEDKNEAGASTGICGMVWSNSGTLYLVASFYEWRISQHVSGAGTCLTKSEDQQLRNTFRRATGHYANWFLSICMRLDRAMNRSIYSLLNLYHPCMTRVALHCLLWSEHVTEAHLAYLQERHFRLLTKYACQKRTTMSLHPLILAYAHSTYDALRTTPRVRRTLGGVALRHVHGGKLPSRAARRIVQYMCGA